MTQRYCSVCKKKTRSVFKLTEKGVETFKCENGHYSPIIKKSPRMGLYSLLNVMDFMGGLEANGRRAMENRFREDL